MKSIQWILLPLCLSLSLSCGKKNENDDGLTFTTSSKIVLLDADLYSCDDILNSTPPSLKSISGKTSSVKIKWTGANELEIQKATLKIRSSALSSGEASFTFTPEGLIYPGNDTTEHVVSCGFRFGGLGIKDKTRSAFMTGVIEMVGITTDSDDNTSAVKATFDIDLEYDP